MKFTDKIITFQDLLSTAQNLKEQTLVLCHGHFNVIHPGHLRFLQYAKQHGDQLIVAVLGDQLLDSSKKTFYNQTERANAVAALHDVDWVIILDQVKLDQLLDIFKPSVYVLGKEFEEEHSNEIQNYIDCVKKYGGKVLFGSGEIHYASSNLGSTNQKTIDHNKIEDFKRICKRNQLKIHSLIERIDTFKNLKFLVIGDTIVDQYVACDPIGMSAEAPVLVLKELNAKDFIGGAAIIASHVQALGARCSYLSVTGNDEPGKFIQKKLNAQNVETYLLIDPDRPTTFKIRYMVDRQKLLRVSRLHEHSISRSLEGQIIEHLEKLLPGCDGLIVSDFVYGTITPNVLEAIIRIAKANQVRLFGDLQCSSQVGNVAKFKDFDLICPTEREARIALGDQESGLEKIAHNLLRETRSNQLLITLGENGFIAYDSSKNQNACFDNYLVKSQLFPALVSNPIDVAGAGDSLLSVQSVGLCAGFNLTEASILGASVAAIAVNRIGNTPITTAELKKTLHQLSQEIDHNASNGIAASVL